MAKPVNTGKGKDRMGSTKDGLRLRWRWLMRCELSGMPENDKRRLPCQVCFAEKQTSWGGWQYEAIDWHDSYEAQVELNGECLVCKKGLATRLDAQRQAESLVREFCEAALRDDC